MPQDTQWVKISKLTLLSEKSIASQTKWNTLGSIVIVPFSQKKEQKSLGKEYTQEKKILTISGNFLRLSNISFLNIVIYKRHKYCSCSLTHRYIYEDPELTIQIEIACKEHEC